MTRILIIQGHPDPAGGHFCHALAAAYEEGARTAGHEVRDIAVATLGLGLLSNQEEWEHGPVSEPVHRRQQDIPWAEHLLIIYPLWLGMMPAVLHAFFEQVLRPGFAIEKRPGGMYRKLLAGRTARIVVTMGMPVLIYRWYFSAHSLKSFERNILRFIGIRPIRESLVGMVEMGGPRRRVAWLETLRTFGGRAR